MRLLHPVLVISLVCLVASCKTYDRQQYSYSYRPGVHVVHEKQSPPPPTESGAPAAPSATAPTPSAQ